MRESITIAFIGNHSVGFSTESHVSASMESLGHRVIRIQEGETRATDVARIVKEAGADIFWHTQTRGLAITGGTDDERRRMALDIKDLGIPYIAYHLDLFFGLDREDYVRDDPYFRECDWLFSTDGGHDEKWAELGINHHYLSPGVFHAEAYGGTPRPEFTSDIAFVGSWRQYSHQEHWPMRRAMLRAVQRRYGRRFVCWPKQQAIRGTDLTDLYASVKVVVGDSCLAGQLRSYMSDRVPETTGRGGFLIHPYVPGILDEHPHLVTYQSGNWAEMLEKVDYFLTNDADRELNRKQCADWTRTHHTYRHKVQRVLEVVYGDNTATRTGLDGDQRPLEAVPPSA